MLGEEVVKNDKLRGRVRECEAPEGFGPLLRTLAVITRARFIDRSGKRAATLNKREFPYVLPSPGQR